MHFFWQLYTYRKCANAHFATLCLWAIVSNHFAVQYPLSIPNKKINKMCCCSSSKREDVAYKQNWILCLCSKKPGMGFSMHQRTMKIHLFIGFNGESSEFLWRKKIFVLNKEKKMLVFIIYLKVSTKSPRYVRVKFRCRLIKQPHKYSLSNNKQYTISQSSRNTQ